MNDKADPVVALAKLLSLFVTAATAEAIAPQLGTFIAGAVGGVFGVMTWRQSTRTEAVAYVVLAACGAWFFATAFGWAIGSVWSSLGKSPNLYQLCAVGIGSVGHRWPAVLAWFGAVIKSTVDRRSEKAGP